MLHLLQAQLNNQYNIAMATVLMALFHFSNFLAKYGTLYLQLAKI